MSKVHILPWRTLRPGLDFSLGKFEFLRCDKKQKEGNETGRGAKNNKRALFANNLGGKASESGTKNIGQTNNRIC